MEMHFSIKDEIWWVFLAGPLYYVKKDFLLVLAYLGFFKAKVNLHSIYCIISLLLSRNLVICVNILYSNVELSLYSWDTSYLIERHYF